ncbi:molecular chaperone [Aeromonas jandaei]|uniref:fimbrial biogenesis chaperone n=1 Tax=Aeromonas jandaei TaxID=650 RepID=UPI002B053ACC|nr:fimbria/pilus periplasmic chaperone [Aeromonas jandaei]
MYKLLLFMMGVFFTNFVSGGVTLDRTRVVLFTDEMKQSMSLVNLNDYPVYVQLWIGDDENDNPDKVDSPLIVLPSTLQLVNQEKSVISLMNLRPKQKLVDEKMFWLHINEVPAIKDNDVTARESSSVRIGMKTLYKVFLRPRKLGSLTFTNVIGKVTCVLNGKGVDISNKSDFHLSIVSLSVYTKNEYVFEVGKTLIPRGQIKVLSNLNNVKRMRVNMLDDSGTLMKVDCN